MYAVYIDETPPTSSFHKTAVDERDSAPLVTTN